jgi:hypothetical protein
MRKRSSLLRVGSSLLLAAVILNGCVVSPYPAHYHSVVVAPRPYYAHPYYGHPYYGHPYDGYHHGYGGSGGHDWH